MASYKAMGSFNDAILSEDDRALINMYKDQYQQAYNSSSSSTPWTDPGVTQWHDAAESVRSGYGYSGGGDGSEYIPLGGSSGSGSGSGSGKNTGGNVSNSVISSPSQSVPEFSYGGSQPTYSGGYENQINQLLGDILSRDSFSYDHEKDDVYKSYEKAYRREGSRSMQDTLGSVAANTGGIASSYAVGAAQQAGDYYSAKLADKVPELYQLAYDMYLDDIDKKVRDLGLVQSMDNTSYNRYRDTMSDWRNDLDFAYNQYVNQYYRYV